jgi:diguanylate cyclase (GGDEF)-like protein
MDKLMAEVGRLREELEQARKRIGYLEELADRDALAPVMNRRAFVRELARMIAFAERYGVAGSVLYLDVDGMKQVNDTHGHAAGDAALQQVAEILLGNIRKSDVVGRLGGDEFGVILAQASPEEGAAKAAVLAAAIEASPAEWRGTKLELGVSFGVYTFAGGEQAAEALDAADKAMYAQKRASDAERR